jgi:REP element-mobilizing transposase RayT
MERVDKIALSCLRDFVVSGVVVIGIFITCSCYRRQPFLASARRRDLFLNILEEVRIKYQFTIAGYVVMPEHFHLLVSGKKGTA